MKSRVKEAVRDTLAEATRTAEENLDTLVRDGGRALQEAIQERIAGMVNKVNEHGQKAATFVGVHEDEILTYVPDKRNFNGVGALLIGLLILVILPGPAKSLAIVAFVVAAVQALFGYVLHSKVDVPEGYEGVMCQFGKPLSHVRAHRGRNWVFPIQRFITYLVSNRDQVVDAFNVNFTSDYVTIGLGKQIVFRVVDHGKFVSNTTPSGAMKLLSLYASYLSLRMITSIKDARVRFTGRDQLDNVIQALNGYLEQICGIRVIRVNMPQAENSVLDDLEDIRTSLKEIEALQQTRTVRLESAVKAVEQEVRQLKIESRSGALALQKATIGLETYLGEITSETRQEILMAARQKLDQTASEAMSAIAELKANVEKSKSLQASLPGLKSSWELKLAELRQLATRKLMPKTVKVLAVDGIGVGVGMSSGPQFMRKVLSSTAIPPET